MVSYDRRAKALIILTNDNHKFTKTKYLGDNMTIGDIAVVRTGIVTARKKKSSTSLQTYEYKILNRRLPIPTERLYSYFVYMPLDVEKMKQAAQYIVGEHDFKSFCSNRTQVENTVRTIYKLDVFKENDMIHVVITGNGFLYNMVRIIIGTLVKVGLGVYPPEHVKEILEAKDRNVAGPKAPAEGLTLVRIQYEELGEYE